MKNNYKQYSRKGYIDKVNPQFIGIAETVQFIRKERKQSQKKKESIYHEVSWFNKINSKLEKDLRNKRTQLKFVQEMKQRYLTQLKERQLLHELKSLEIQKLKQKTQQLKLEQNFRSKKAKQLIFKRKKSISEQMKYQNLRLKTQRDHQKQYQMKLRQSRVNAIQQEKKRIKKYCNNFHKSKNKEYYNNYQRVLKTQSNTTALYKNEVKDLQLKLMELKQKTEKKKSRVLKMNESIKSLRNDSQILRQSRMHTQRSRKRTTQYTKTPSDLYLTEAVQSSKQKFNIKINNHNF